ncbi:MAG: mannose-1-phosphate guanylyltransferase [Proteobacteria bacterium]|nr:mannose-1-phosphate guanylyltransferase [Pseudomonadota bacterium]
MRVMPNVYAIILAGGEGTRFVPYSTPERPKQFLNVIDNRRTMIQQTFDRVSGFVPGSRCFVATNDRYRALVAEQLPEIPPENVIGEPKKKNTAPAIALASSLIHRRDSNAVTVFTPADHYIPDYAGAISAFEKAAAFAADGRHLVTFGIPPTFPSPEYGYIHEGDAIQGSEARMVKEFVEKPDVPTAERYIATGHYLWNSGMFVWKADALLGAVREHLPQMAEQLSTLKLDPRGGADQGWVNRFFDEVQGISIDYGVMEKAKNVAVFPFPVSWSDIGTWQSLAEMAARFKITLPLEVQGYLKEKIK